jgi:hypothetical protein
VLSAADDGLGGVHITYLLHSHPELVVRIQAGLRLTPGIREW